MKVETKELVNVTDDKGNAVNPGDMIIIAYRQNVPDTIAEFVGLGRAQTIEITCAGRTFRIRQTSIKSLVVINRMTGTVENDE